MHQVSLLMRNFLTNHPTKFFAQTLTSMCGEERLVFVYYAYFEKAHIRDELSNQFPSLEKSLLTINNRTVYLLLDYLYQLRSDLASYLIWKRNNYQITASVFFLIQSR
ncbi:hypothetical protein NMYAN_60115 [Nitrosomonas nitrosa]|uniref:DUF2779 domain-containing protein n=2 Tax=Nitrosomonas nitrosa TaxID=52442 RepID=A0A8H8Z1P0_9PROT|nr:hypothetical protein NMYAN_60115 [Nitrosomonas nitrosa]